MVKFLKHFFDNLEKYFSQLLISIFVSLLFMQVVLRAGWNFTFSWSEELSRFAFVWFVYMSASYAVRVAAHCRVIVHLNLLGPRARTILLAFADLIWIGFNCAMVFYGYHYVLGMFEFPYISPTLGWSMAYLYMIIPISFAAMTIRIIQVNYLRFVKKQVIEEKQ
jgi:C4-dicarboxylate transporter, DctQ subunit